MSSSIEQRVARAAEEILAAQQHVGAVEVLNWIGWLPAPRIDEWRQGRVECLESTMQVRPEKIPKALQQWAEERGLVAAEMEYVARTRDRRTLRFSVSGAADVERAYHTHWTSPQLSEVQRDRLVERQSTPPELVVIMPLKVEPDALAAAERG